MSLQFRRQCDKSNKHILCVQKPGRMSSETAVASPRCGFSFRNSRETAMWQLSESSNGRCQKPRCAVLVAEIRTRNPHRHVWLRLSPAGRKETACTQTSLIGREAVRQTYTLLPAMWAWASPLPPLSLSFPRLGGQASTHTKCLLQGRIYSRYTVP